MLKVNIATSLRHLYSTILADFSWYSEALVLKPESILAHSDKLPAFEASKCKCKAGNPCTSNNQEAHAKYTTLTCRTRSAWPHPSRSWKKSSAINAKFAECESTTAEYKQAKLWTYAIIKVCDSSTCSRYFLYCPSSVRRGSVWVGGTTMAPLSVGQALKDNRPLRDRPFQAKMRQDLYNYLNESGYEISMPMLTSMQGKDYRAIFDTLVLTLDPWHPLKEGVLFEDEFIPALKALQYPFAHQINTEWLAAVASPHSWPYLLGVLHWLMELCKVP